MKEDALESRVQAPFTTDASCTVSLNESMHFASVAAAVFVTHDASTSSYGDSADRLVGGNTPEACDVVP